MKGVLFTIILFFSYSVHLWGQASHLLLSSQGDGAQASLKDGPKELLKRASYLPRNQLISVRPRSGLETLAAGFQFRFGSETRFELEENAMRLHAGSIMIQSRNIQNITNLIGPEASVRLSGSGCCMLEVETNGGFKVIGILGRFRMEIPSAGKSQDLMPGELLFVMPGDRGFGDKVYVNVGKIIETSYLISGFSNAASFRQSLATISAAQENSIGKTFAAEVGDAKAPDRFEVLPKVVSNAEAVETGSEKLSASESYAMPGVDPLLELLGRSPKRMEDSAGLAPTPEDSPNVQGQSSAKEDTQNAEIQSPRPFPSRLLRTE
ncbi:MAG: hypothetical protein CBC00_06045 [Verrucomicrobia bacterium TMED40]|mgnify:FL=1|nr:MAG: hypothetical protein CBC00_06045 [Verrucomicrobia bacterium TMED40]|tara:strand:+ start:3295 stop:4260 length:966 start_codon:yes stop_codon:yes gene_type:complete